MNGLERGMFAYKYDNQTAKIGMSKTSLRK